jgi:hypothetical protein
MITAGLVRSFVRVAGTATLALAACSACSALKSSMREMQVHSDGLGSAVAVRDAAAAGREVDAIDATLARIKADNPMRGDIKLAEVASSILEPTLPPVRQSVTAGDWAAARQNYLAVVDSCNRCHSATGKQDLVIKANGVRP